MSGGRCQTGCLYDVEKAYTLKLRLRYPAEPCNFLQEVLRPLGLPEEHDSRVHACNKSFICAARIAPNAAII